MAIRRTRRPRPPVAVAALLAVGGTAVAAVLAVTVPAGAVTDPAARAVAGRAVDAPDPSGSPSQPAGGCGSAVFCDGFESQGTGTPSGNWSLQYPDCQGAGTATVDTAVAHGGSRSVRVNGAAGYCGHVFLRAAMDLKAVGRTVHVRFWVRHSTALPADHVSFVSMPDSADNNKALRMGGQNKALQWNRESDDATLPAQSPVGVSQSAALPTGSWQCLEFGVGGADGTLRTWLNGTAVAGLTADGSPTPDIDQQWMNKNWRPSLTALRLGWESYGNGTDTLWYDDVAVSASRIGC